jgi:transcriptional regulator with XRE-family HTH domain
MKITGDQVKAARILLGWKQPELAAFTRLSKSTISYFETGRRRPSIATVSEIRFVIERAGVEFTRGSQSGVRLRKTK